MAGLGFQTKHARPIATGAKPITMRKPRADGSDPKLGDPLYLFLNWRTPQVVKFATARCVMRGLLMFNAQGQFARAPGSLDIEPSAPKSVQAVVLAVQGLVVAPHGTKADRLRLQLAQWDGFDSYAAMWDFHHRMGHLNDDGYAVRYVYGLGAVSVEDAFSGLLDGSDTPVAGA